MKIKVNDVKLSYDKYGFGKSIWLVLHGNRDKKEYLTGIAKAISNKQNNLVYNIDFRGHGESDKPKYKYSLDMLIEDVEEFCRKNKFDKVNILGHSLGATVAMEMCLRKKIEIEKLILLSATAYFVPKFRPPDLSDYSKISVDEIHENAKKFLFSPKYPEVIDKIIGHWKEIDMNVHKSILGIKHPDMRDKLGNINCKTLIICGEEDKSTTVEDAKLLNSNIKNSYLVTIPNASHYQFMEQPQMVEKIISEFV